MPVVTLTLDDTSKSIKTSMYRKIVQDIVDSIGIEYDAITTIYSGIDISRTDNDSNASILSKTNLPSTVSQRRVLARVTSLYDEDSLTPTVVTQRENPPIYLDRSVDTSMTVIYIKSDTTIEVDYICPSKSEAGRILDDIRVKLSQCRNILHHEVDYNIILPKAAEDFITDVYDLKNRLIPSTLSAYFGEFVTNRAHIITDLTTVDNARIAIKERQVRIVGFFDFSPLPDPYEKDNDNNTYKITIRYKVKLDIPTQLYITYPTMVANKPMPYKYLEFIQEKRNKRKDEWRKNLSYSVTLSALSEFEAHRQLEYRMRTDLPFALPMFDQCEDVKPHPGYVTLCTVLSSVDETDSKGLLNLREIDTDYCFDDRFLELIKATELRQIVQPYETFFYIGLNQKNLHYDNNILTIDNDLNVKSRVELSLLKPVRMTFNLCINFSMIRVETWIRIKKNRDLLLYYLTEMFIARINFPNEGALSGLTDEHIMKMLLDLMIEACRNGEHDFIGKLIETMKVDMGLASKFAVFIFNDYPSLYVCLNKHSRIEEYRKTNQLKRNFTRNDNYKIRTVLTTYVDVRDITGNIGGSSKNVEEDYFKGKD